jgi:hypothetical protein
MSRYLHCLYCDDVRMELGNKMSLMGIYNADFLVVGTAPIIIPKLAVAVWVISDIDDRPTRLNFLVKWRDGVELAKLNIPNTSIYPVQHREGATRVETGFFVNISPFSIERTGVVETTVETEKVTLIAGRLYVQIQTPPAQPAVATG